MCLVTTAAVSGGDPAKRRPFPRGNPESSDARTPEARERGVGQGHLNVPHRAPELLEKKGNLCKNHALARAGRAADQRSPCIALAGPAPATVVVSRAAERDRVVQVGLGGRAGMRTRPTKDKYHGPWGLPGRIDGCGYGPTSAKPKEFSLRIDARWTTRV